MKQPGNTLSSWQQPAAYICWSPATPSVPFLALLQGSAVATSLGSLEFEIDS